MCGRYYIDLDMAEEIEQIARIADRKISRIKGDIFPGTPAPVIAAGESGPEVCMKRWGFTGFGRQKIIFNARSETALEKGMFRNSVLHTRCVIPAGGFYEWNKAKEMFTFREKDGRGLYMAGFFRKEGEEDRFVILTTQANEFVRPVHERMPLILKKAEIGEWLEDDRSYERLLVSKPGALERFTDYEQGTLW